jgi:diguanylate cyclase (GGDEF)-like protein/PAS domain S-box-containing protein
MHIRSIPFECAIDVALFPRHNFPGVDFLRGDGVKEEIAQYGSASAEVDKYRRVFHATPDYATFSNLLTGVFIDVNPGFERLIGYTREEVVGRTSASIDLWVHPHHRDAVAEQLQRTDAMSIETQFRGRNGDIFDVEASLASFRLDGEFLLVAIARDVTARKRQELELQQYKDSLEKLVTQRTAELESAMQKLKDLAAHDELTGIGNRRDLNFHLGLEHRNFRRSGLPSSIAVFDLDHFKEVNDRLGHVVGDEVIRVFAQIIRQTMRDVDYVARYGGDEFVLILKGASGDGATASLGRIREAVLAYPWAALTPGIALTTSIGVASFHMNETAEQTFRRADKALYRAKQDGRNRIVMADMP